MKKAVAFFFSSKSEFSLVSNSATCVNNCLNLHECKPTWTSSKDKVRVDLNDVLHVSFWCKNGRIKKETKLNHNSIFDKYSTKLEFFYFLNGDLLQQWPSCGQLCYYALAASCIIGYLCGLLSSFVGSLSLRTSLYHSCPNTISTFLSKTS